MRDGVPFWHTAKAPRGYLPNIPASSREAELLARRKIFALRYQRFIEPNQFVRLGTPRFLVDKLVEDGIVLDVRCVWDCKRSGLNSTLWAPGFMLPTFRKAEDQVVKWLSTTVREYLERGSPVEDYTQDAENFIKSYQGDIDVGKHFNNFRIPVKERPLFGVRVIHTNNAQGAKEKEEWYRATCLMFGASPSPVMACQGERRIIEQCKGDRHDPSNAFHWKEVYLNLPCSENRDPSLPSVLLLREDGEMACVEASFVDDIHVAGRGERMATKACRQLKTQMNTRGNQAEDKKYRPVSLNPGAWIGSMIHTSTPFPLKSTTAKKWRRLRDGLKWLLEKANLESHIDTAELRRMAGLGVHVTEVYTYGRSFLKGFFNALESFRGDRDLDGWRLTDRMLAAKALETEDATRREAAEGYPLTTRITEELVEHAQAMLDMFYTEEPMAIPIRPTDKSKLRYGAFDASAEGFGGGTQYPDDHFEESHGLWIAKFADGGSNLREAQAQGNHLLEAIQAGKHDGCELWFFTDNSAWSAVWLKGMSKAKHLFKIVLQLKLECMKHEVWLNIRHASGNRMIAAGIDGMSRGNQDAGVALGHDIRLFFPLHKGAFDLQPVLLSNWCRMWMEEDYRPPLGPEGWFVEGHRPGVHLWAPPPSAALIALEELAESRLKRFHNVTHVFICPRLCFYEEWRSRFQKEVDFWIFLEPGQFWPHDMYEPLVVGISFPLRRRDSGPWLVRQNREAVVEMGRALHELSKASHVQVGRYLRELWRDPWSLSKLSERLVRRLLCDP